MTDHFIPSRRDFLKSVGALAVGFSLAGYSIAAFAEEPIATKPLALTSVDTFLAVDSANIVTVYSGKVDLGTGVQTALAQIVAEELDVPFRNVNVVQGDTALTPDSGSAACRYAMPRPWRGTRSFSSRASTRLGVRADELTIADGVVSGGGKQVSYGELIAGKTFSLTLDHQKPPATKDAKTFKIVGTSVARVDIPHKVTGKFACMQDFRVPGMLHGRVVRPPAIGAQLQNVDEKSIEGIPDNVRIVREGNFLGVVAENEWAAIPHGRSKQRGRRGRDCSIRRKCSTKSAPQRSPRTR